MRKEFRIFGMSYSQSQIGSYIIVLSDIEDESIKIPIIIKQTDAQYIALKVENIETKTPATQDLIVSIIKEFNSDIQEVFIHSMIEGIFYSNILINNGLDVFTIPATVGDSISLSISFSCPIFVSDEVINKAGIIIDEEGNAESPVKSKTTERTISVENLENMLQKAIENEEYEIASQLRDRIKELKNNQ